MTDLLPRKRVASPTLHMTRRAGRAHLRRHERVGPLRLVAMIAGPAHRQLVRSRQPPG